MRELSVAEQRYRAVMAVMGDGLAVSLAAEKVGVRFVSFATVMGPPVRQEGRDHLFGSGA